MMASIQKLRVVQLELFGTPFIISWRVDQFDLEINKVIS